MAEWMRKAGHRIALLAVIVLGGLYLQAMTRLAPADGGIAELAVFVDRSGLMELADVMPLPFTPARPSYTAGYSPSAHWMRLRVVPSASGEETVLQLSQNTLDSVVLYLPPETGDSGWTALGNGDTVPFAQKAAKLLPVSFAVPPQTGNRFVYLRIASTSAVSFRVTAEPLSQAEKRLNLRISVHVVYFGLMMMGLLLAAFRLHNRRTALSFSVTGLMVVYLVYSAEALGYAPVLMDLADPSAHSRISNLGAALTVLLSMLVHRLYFSAQAANRFALACADALIGAAAVCFLLMLAKPGLLLGGTFSCLSLAFLLVVPVFLVTARGMKQPAGRVASVIYIFYIGISTVWLGSRLGLFDAAAISLHFVELFGLVNLCIILTILFVDRQQRNDALRDRRIALTAARAEQAANARNASVQEGFVYMLLHELRNNLSVLQMSVPDGAQPARRARMAGAVRDLNRALWVAQCSTWLAQDTWPVNQQPVSIVEALDRAIDELGCADRIELAGDSTETEIEADAAMVGACLSEAIAGLTGLAAASSPVRVTLTQSTGASPCTLTFQVDLPYASQGIAVPVATRFALMAQILRRMGGHFAFGPTDMGRLDLFMTLPRHGLLVAPDVLDPAHLPALQERTLP